jgi:Domain of unknown function (DUF1851)
MELTKRWPEQAYVAALKSWAWVDIAGKTPLFTSLFGDVFFEDQTGVWMLDLLVGKLKCVWPDRQQCAADLATEAGQDDYLLAGLAISVNARGLVLGEDQVYEFARPPVLGGAVSIDQVGMADFVVTVNIAGQIHDQVRHLPPGAKVGRTTLDGQ